MDVIGQVWEEIDSRKLLAKGDRLIVAVSGGVDSMVLLNVLTRLAPKLELELTVAHFNHQLRGAESDGDEQFVRNQAQEQGIAFHSEQGKVRDHAEAHGLSIEMAARALRHRFLASLAESLGIRKVALAHHADDQVETLWLNLVRGSVGAGLGGMKWSSASPANPEVQLVRPLLSLRRKEIGQHAKENEVRFQKDATNDQTDFLRNRIRLELLPLLEKAYQPAVAENSLRLMEVLGAEKECLLEQAGEWLRERKQPFAQLHRAVQRLILHERLIECEVSPKFELIEQLRRHPEVPVSVSPGIQVVCGHDGILRREQATERRFRADFVDLEVCGDHQVAWGGVQFRWEVLQEARVEKSQGVELFDADRVGQIIRLRHWQPGDMFQPIGMPSPVKLQDLFTNAKITLDRRRALILAENHEGRIFWVEGLRISELAKVRPETLRFLRWHWERD